MNKVKVINSVGINHSNMLNTSDHRLRKTNQASFKKIHQYGSEDIIQLQDGGVSFLEEIDESHAEPGMPKSIFNDAVYRDNEKLLNELMNQEFDIFEVVMKKFNMHSTTENSHGCFS